MSINSVESSKSIPEKTLKVGMTREEVYKQGSDELMELFNFADKDDNHVLDSVEIRRYNNPILVVNYEEKINTRTITNGTVDRYILGFLPQKQSVNLTTITMKNTEEEFHVGLKLEDVSKKGTEIFAAIDSNRDGELSEDEMQKIGEIKDKISEALSIVERKIKNNTITGYSIIGGIGAVGAGCAIALAAKETISLTLAGAASAGIVGAVGGFFIGALLAAGTYDTVNAIQKNNLEKTFEKTMGELNSHPYAKFAKEYFINIASEMFNN